MRKDPKKIVAATIGVVEYLKLEREHEQEQKRAALGVVSPAAVQQSQPAASLWAASGRMEIMRFRNLMELKVFRRGR